MHCLEVGLLIWNSPRVRPVYEITREIAMGRLFVEYLGEGRKYACKECLAGCTGGHSVVHLAAVSDLLSKVREASPEKKNPAQV